MTSKFYQLTWLYCLGLSNWFHEMIKEKVFSKPDKLTLFWRLRLYNWFRVIGLNNVPLLWGVFNPLFGDFSWHCRMFPNVRFSLQTRVCESVFSEHRCLPFPPPTTTHTSQRLTTPNTGTGDKHHSSFWWSLSPETSSSITRKIGVCHKTYNEGLFLVFMESTAGGMTWS